MRINKKGFTIIELMIATTVLGVLLLIVSAAIIGLTRQFYKGINQSKTQEVARTIADELASNIQYSSKEPVRLTNTSTGETLGWCISDQRYLFKTGVILQDDPDSYVLNRDSDCSSTNKTGGVELVGERMRLIKLDIQTSPSAYRIEAVIGLGEGDLFCSPSVSGSCEDSSYELTPTELKNGDLRCKGGAGGQYCSVARSAVTVVRRL